MRVDSFSQLHSYSYSIIALQELNLNFYYSRVYWNCACLSIEATGITDEGIDKTKTSSTNYGEVSKAIYKMKKYGVDVTAPSINESDVDFRPVVKTDSILFGISGIAGINNDIANQILSNRPYESFKDFYEKNSYKGSLITESKFIQLIKAGCFDEFEPNRIKVMKKYVALSTPTRTALTAANLPEVFRIGAELPASLRSPYKFKKYVLSSKFLYGLHPNFKTKKVYWLDDKAKTYFIKNLQDDLQEGTDYWEENDKFLIVDKSLEKALKQPIEALKEYINSPDFITEFNRKVMRAKYNEIVPNEDTNKWSFDACSYYSVEHELVNLNFDEYNIDHFGDLPLEPKFEEKTWGKRTWKQYELSAICGTVLARNDSHHLITILTPDYEVVNIKMNDGAFAHYKNQISIKTENGKKEVLEKSWLSRGTLLICCGYRRGEDDFVCKKYKNSIYRHQLMKIIKVYENGDIDIQSERYGSEEE